MPVWDGTSDKVTIDYRQLSTNKDGEAQKEPPRTGWLSNRKGYALRFLLIVVTFFVGLIVGYVIRREVHSNIAQKISQQPIGGNCTEQIKDYNPEVSRKLRRFLDAENIREFVKQYTSSLDEVGTKGGLSKAGDILKMFQRWKLNRVYDATYRVRLSYPGLQLEPSNPANIVKLLDSTNSTVYSCETSFASSAAASDVSHTYNYIPYSPAGTAEGQLVFANYGRAEDFETLRNKNISVEGRIILLRYKDGSQFIDWKQLQKNLHGRQVLGILFFADAENFNHGRHSEVYPSSWWLPGNVTQYRTLSLTAGDLGTPYIPAKDYMLNQDVDMSRSKVKVESLPNIPMQPINYQDAGHLLKQLTKGEPPEGWDGAADASFQLSKLKEGQKIKLTTFNEEVVKTIKNVIGIIVGKEEPDRHVIVGAHHDSLVEGSIARGSGLGIVMELAQKFMDLVHDERWKPRRTIIFAIWDATEFGAIGSTEWIEEYEVDLSVSTVAYINLDAVVKGNIFMAAGHPLLKQVLYAATKTAPCPLPDHNINVYDQWRLNSNNPEPGLGFYTASSELLSCTDCTGFEMGLGTPSLQFGYTYPKEMKIKNFPVFQTYLDRFEYLHTFIDKNFTIHKAVAEVTADVVLRLADSALLPFSMTDFVDSLIVAYNNTVSMHKDALKGDLMADMDTFYKAIGALKKAATMFQVQTQNVTFLSPLTLREVNNKLMRVTRALSAPELYTTDSEKIGTYIGRNIFPFATEDSNGLPVFLNLHRRLTNIEENMAASAQLPNRLNHNDTESLKTGFRRIVGIHVWKMLTLTTYLHSSVLPHEHDVETDS